jgi:hypothetical protein
MYPYTRDDYNDPFNILNKYLTRLSSIDSVTIDYSSVISSSLGWGDHDRFNLFILNNSYETNNMKTSSIMLNSYGFPLSLNGSIEKHGTYPYVSTTEFGLFAKQPKWEIMAAWNHLLVHWYAKQHMLQNGTIQIIGNEDTRIGKSLIIKKNNSGYKYDMIYYIEQYQDSWRFPGLWTQNLLLTRGSAMKDGNWFYYVPPLTENNNEFSWGTNNISNINRG